MYTQDYESYGTMHDTHKAMSINPRLGFVRKVYGILSIQLLVTALFVAAASVESSPLFRFFHYNGANYPSPLANMLVMIAGVISFIVCIMITCCTGMARSVPTNYYLLSIFTICEAYLVGYITSFYTGYSVLYVALLTLSLTLTLTIYACTTKTDFTGCGALLWVLGWGLFCMSAFTALWYWGKVPQFTRVSISVAAIVIYGFYLIYDTQLIMGGGKYALTLDDYVLAALVIYIDIVVLFIRILSILGQRR
jgi:FtsH-binding integral membrane protein